jgi:hypothetical protein
MLKIMMVGGVGDLEKSRDINFILKKYKIF